jgi:hypothetical protein
MLFEELLTSAWLHPVSFQWIELPMLCLTLYALGFDLCQFASIEQAAMGDVAGTDFVLLHNCRAAIFSS